MLGESSNISLFPTAPRAYLSFPSPISNPSHFSMQVSTRPPSSRRTSHSEMRGRAPLPVASGAPQNPQNPQNGHSRNPSALDVARSPPNQSNKSKSGLPILFISIIAAPRMRANLLQSSIQTLNMFRANSFARVPVRQAPLVLFYTPPMPELTTLLANILQRYEIGSVSKFSLRYTFSEAVGS